ncbi:transcriptional regulator domain-containing protein [Sphingomonas koreensis]|uniref:transcriptional regulator domain-containing protein n=1 Tax=Sphingomonas koreensis TaxID=93064 RepID=UPI00353114DB
MPRPDWRDPAPYRRLRGIDRAGLLWEWLRRDPAYIAWYTSASRATRDRGGKADPLIWGLYFRRGPRPRLSRSLPDLGRQHRSEHSAHERAAGRAGRYRSVRSELFRSLAHRRDR